MGNVWLRDLPDVLRPYVGRGLAGIQTVAGWETRARSTGGLDQVLGIVWHHTASKPGSDGKRDASYIATGGPTPPISQLYIDRNGVVWIVAAGAANHAGKGGPVSPTSPAPWLKKDEANRYTIGIEMANDGVGEVWPVKLLEAAITLGAVLTRHYRFPLERNIGHRDWCGPGTSTPGRKIDPMGSWADGPAWPTGTTWGPFGQPLTTFRSLIAQRIAQLDHDEADPPRPVPPIPTPPPPPPPAATGELYTRAIPGDSYWGIARRIYGVADAKTVKALMDANRGAPLRSGEYVRLIGRAVLP